VGQKGKAMNHVERNYLPAAGRAWALPLYDPLVKLLGGDKARRALLDQADLGNAHRVLDIGCGTGTLATLIKRLHPNLEVVGLDPDPKALSRGRQKAGLAKITIQFDQGFSDELPYPDRSFSRVFSSFMFHHLQAGQKEKTLQEVRRVLAPGGSLHLLDFEDSIAHPHGFLGRWSHSSHRVPDNSEERTLTRMRWAGFADAKKVMDGAMFFGILPVGYYQASVASAASSQLKTGSHVGLTSG
jgi:ubiquinone/menaquinone biosynthesis C-methylase UbiE